MPFSHISAFVAPLTVDGDSTGHVTVAVITTPKVGTKGYLYSSAAGSLAVEVATSDPVTGILGLRQLPLSNADIGLRLTYGMCASLAAWKVADGAVFMGEAQDIKTQPPYRSAS